jgi:hypothetical protein
MCTEKDIYMIDGSDEAWKRPKKFIFLGYDFMSRKRTHVAEKLQSRRL